MVQTAWASSRNWLSKCDVESQWNLLHYISLVYWFLMMNKVELKNSGGKRVTLSDLRQGLTLLYHKKKRRRFETCTKRSLRICKKLENLKLEMNRYNINHLVMSEMKWPDQGDICSDDCRFIFSGDKNKIASVGIIMRKELPP